MGDLLSRQGVESMRRSVRLRPLKSAPVSNSNSFQALYLFLLKFFSKSTFELSLFLSLLSVNYVSDAVQEKNFIL